VFKQQGKPVRMTTVDSGGRAESLRADENRAAAAESGVVRLSVPRLDRREGEETREDSLEIVEARSFVCSKRRAAKRCTKSVAVIELANANIQREGRGCGGWVGGVGGGRGGGREGRRRKMSSFPPNTMRGSR
jgi:hypothetical protein